MVYYCCYQILERCYRVYLQLDEAKKIKFTQSDDGLGNFYDLVGVIGEEFGERKESFCYDQEEVDNVEEWNLRSDIDLVASERSKKKRRRYKYRLLASNGSCLPKAKRDMRKKGGGICERMRGGLMASESGLMVNNPALRSLSGDPSRPIVASNRLPD
ncbi:hypothetical protein CDAR_316411 [Caerostris darwini]|uniref:Uncharacterized protein n=1 Tax=Caerostris darwini TaxID=1538125 RepID=A0AAV4UKL7_9ARAC|nr:hypothetical protein CDAR_316411 [Caerostris darwini]